MDELDEQFILNCKWFWNNKEDMERYIGFDQARLEKLDPQLAKAWREYKLAYDLLYKLTKQFDYDQN